MTKLWFIDAELFKSKRQKAMDAKKEALKKFFPDARWLEENKMIVQVLEWHQKFGVDIGRQPNMIKRKRFEMRHNILLEEVCELALAFERGDKVQVADAICDILYVIIGTAIEFGMHEKLTALFDEVHRSNMSKLDEKGNPVKREDGKILKSALFSPPNLTPILANSKPTH